MFEDFKVPNSFTLSDPRFGAGPSLIPSRYVQSLLETGPHLLGTSHRKSPVKNLCKGIQEGIKRYFGVPDDYLVCLGNGGATLLFDMIALGAVEKKAAHFTCGEFSNKWYKSSELVPWIEAVELETEYGKGCEPTDVDGADLICCTLNETSTGVQLASTPSLKSSALLAVDATSGGGQCPFDVAKADFYFFSPQKVFASEGGLFICIMSPRAIERVMSIGSNKGRYIPEIMNWKVAIENSEKNQTYNTPAIATLYFLNEQIKAMNVLGYKKVQELAKAKADLVYGWAEKKDYLSPYVQDKKFRSQAVACVDVDEKLPVDGLISALEKQKFAYGIDAYRKLGRNQFRIGMFHNIAYEDLEKLTQVLSVALEG